MSYHKSIVTNAVNTERTYDNQYGQFYLHQINFADGNHGEYMSKDPNQQTFVVGVEKDYEIIPNDQGYAAKIKPYNPQYDQQAQQVAQEIAPTAVPRMENPPPQDIRNDRTPPLTQQQAINKTVALKEAVNYSDRLGTEAKSIDKTLSYADAFDGWLNGLYVKGPVNDPNNVDPDGIPF